MATIADSVPKIDWLYPELLSEEGLVEILSQRFVKLPNERISKDELLELYYKYILPRPQRQYRLNRRGREMKKKQIIMDKKMKLTQDTQTTDERKPRDTASRLFTSFEGVTNRDRLKPPPSCINSEKKVIKLGSAKWSADASTPTTDQGVSALKKIRLSSIPSSAGDSQISLPVTCSGLHKTIKLINSHVENSRVKTERESSTETKSEKPQKLQQPNGKEEVMETDEALAPPPSKKVIKIKRITWP